MFITVPDWDLEGLWRTQSCWYSRPQLAHRKKIKANSPTERENSNYLIKTEMFHSDIFGLMKHCQVQWFLTDWLWAKSPLSQLTKLSRLKNHTESGWLLLAQWKLFFFFLSCIILRRVYRKMSSVYFFSIALGCFWDMWSN